MYRQETITPYQKGSKAEQVEDMFNNIAHSYDRLNHRLSWNIDRGWRRNAIRQLFPYQPQTILDVATGTGDFAIMAAQMLKPKQLIGTDISEGMMEVAKDKTRQRGLDNIITYKRDDCMQLSFGNDTFDAITAAFGIRNFPDLDKGLSEMYRVLKKNGHLSIVELTRPPRFPMRQLFSLYSHTILPIYGRMVSKDPKAYSYLTNTIEAFPQGEEMMGILRKAGFKETTFRRLTFGICTMYFATK